MRLLGIDYGRAKVGLAISEGMLAEPFSVLRYDDEKALVEKIKALVDKERIDKVVVGVSEGKSAEEARGFGQNLKRLGIEYHFIGSGSSRLFAAIILVIVGVISGRKVTSRSPRSINVYVWSLIISSPDFAL